MGLWRQNFRAMNTDVEVFLPGERAGAKLEKAALSKYFITVERGFAASEKRFSRFDPESELSCLNASGENWVFVSASMLQVLMLAARATEQTGGLFTPFVLDALIEAGYDRSFEQLASCNTLIAQGRDKSNIPVEHPASHTSGGFSQSSCFHAAPFLQESAKFPQLQCYPQLGAVERTPGVGIDLSGIVKSWTVWQLSRWLQKQGFSRGLINAGGDLYAWGRSGSSEASRWPSASEGVVMQEKTIMTGGVSLHGSKGRLLWRVEVASPWEREQSLTRFLLTDGAVATSATTLRSWQGRDGRVCHHLIDPRTGRPSQSDVVQCTVVAKNPVQAEIAAKVVCIAGFKEGIDLLQQQQQEWSVAAVHVCLKDGRTLKIGG